MTELALITAADSADAQEKALQQKLSCDLLSAATDHYGFFLKFEAAGLTLYQNHPQAPGGLCVEFSAPDIERRRKQGIRSQGLGKALGLKKLKQATVLDATAGLGRDAFLMAAAGCQLQLLEKSAVVWALLADGLARASRAGGELATISARVQLQHNDFLNIAGQLSQVDIVYLDPMFPQPGKRGKSKKGMFLLQELLGHDEERPELLSAARALAKHRVVVKRARLSPALAGVEPDISFKGSSNRYDVYLNPTP